VDAGFVLLQREGRPLPQHHHAQRLHKDISIWFRPLQYSNFIDPVVPNEPETVPPGQAGLLSANGQLWLDDR